MAITKRQRQVYDFLYEFVQKNGYSPSFEEIGNGLGLSSLATVHKHISNLEKKGLLKRDYNRSRSIDVLPVRGLFKRQAKAPSEVALPLMGRIAAGQPIEAVETPETISLGDITRSKDVFVLQVKGQSMQDEHIVEGDYVLVEKGNTARDGEIVVALVDGTEATLKRIYREGVNTRLQPSNTAMKPIIVPAKSVQVQGRVVGVLRKY
jgi:repressor LexA